MNININNNNSRNINKSKAYLGVLACICSTILLIPDLECDLDLLSLSCCMYDIALPLACFASGPGTWKCGAGVDTFLS